MNSKPILVRISIFLTLTCLFFGVVLCSSGCTDRQAGLERSLEYFIYSLESANKASEVVDDDVPYEEISKDDMLEIVDYRIQAKVESERVKTNHLNSIYDGLGDHYKNEFITGLELFIQGYGNSDNEKLQEGDELLDQFSAWYNTNVAGIEESLRSMESD